MLDLPEKIIIFDTEYTCWPGSLKRNWSGPNEYQEIVQIGAILADTKKFIELDSLDLLIRPVKNPILSDYFIDLTGITQKDIGQRGIPYNEALLKFFSWCRDYPISSFGGDEEVLKENCGLINIPFLFSKSQFIDLIKVFKKYIPDADKYQSGAIMSAFGKKSIIRPHNALNDARILLDGLRELNGKI